MNRAPVTLALLLALAIPALGDVFILDDRTRIEGRVVEERGDELVIETYEQGPVAVPAARVRQRFERKSELDRYDERASTSPDTADGHHELGKWCKTHGLDWRARKEWEAAVALDPAHEKAHKSLGHRLHEGSWLTEEEYREAQGYVLYEGRWIRKEAAEKLGVAGRVEIDLVVAVKPNADRRFLEGAKTRMEEAARRWFECTDGWMAIRRVRIVDGTDQGDVVLHNLDSDRWWPGHEYGRVEAGRYVYLGGLFPVVTFCHEMGHRWFGLPEEYVDPKCSKCVMNPWTGVYIFCDATNHDGAGGDCWSTILNRYPRWRRRSQLPECPPVEITIEDR